jgi:hypothetical protein
VANTDPPDNLADRLRGGDPRAAEALFDRYAVRLARLAEQHLSRKLAGRVDGEDVVQSVFRTFFHRCARGEFQIDGSAEVWRLLVRLTLRKARAQARRHLAARRDAGAEMRPAPGIAVFGGMFGVTLFGVLLTPVFYVVRERRPGGAVAGERRAVEESAPGSTPAQAATARDRQDADLSVSASRFGVVWIAARPDGRSLSTP